MKVSAIIVCAGNSTRMGGVNKILLPLGNSNVIGTTLTAFENTQSITDIVIVCRDCDRDEIKKQGARIIEDDVIRIEKGTIVHDEIKTAYMIFSCLM